MKRNKFSIKRRIKAFQYAFNGLFYFFKTVHNTRIQLIAAILVICFGYYFQIVKSDWLWIILAIALVFTTECINTAIEKVVDLASQEYHELAKRSKDLAAAAVLIAAIFALIIAVLVFYPYVIK